MTINGIVVDIQWWQGLVGILALLGLSPAPWILGLAAGRIQFSKPAQLAYDARTADLKEQHTQAIAALTNYHHDVVAGKDARYAELKESRDTLEVARTVERDRADKVTAALGEALELARSSAHLLESLDEAAQGKGK